MDLVRGRISTALLLIAGAYDSDEAAAHTGDLTHHLLFSVFVQKNTPSLSVSQFGDWDQKRGGTLPDYSLDLTKIGEMRKQKKRDPSPASLGNEDDELIKPPDSATSTTAKFTKLFMSSKEIKGVEEE